MNILKEKSYTFALDVCKCCINIQKKDKEYVLSKQLLRSVTSISANIHEAQNSESRKDFVHKMSIANKEANETLFWIKLIKDLGLIQEKIAQDFKGTCIQLIRIISKSKITARKGLAKAEASTSS